jgi:ligand-binding sensor domain-containing protein
VAREPVLANLWVGTRGNGLFRFNLLTRQGVSLPFGLAEANVMAVSRDGDSYWFGGVSRSANRNAGITRWTRSTGTWSHSYPSLADGLGDADVTCIESDRREIWFGTGRGIACYDKTRNSWKTLPIPGSPGINRITSLLSTGDTLWIGTSAGLKRLLKSANVIEAVTEPNVDRLGINCLLGLDSTVWVATDRGLYLLSRGRRGSSILSEQTGALDGRVLAVDSDGDGLWCLTPRGLVVYRPAPNEFARFLLPHYLPPSGGFTCLAVGGPYVWIGSAAGAIRFDKKMKRWKVYSVREGLADGLVQDVFLDGDYVWFGTPRGVTSFHWNSPAGLSP